MKKFTYNGQEYSSLYQVRQEIWKQEHKVFGAWNDSFKSAFGVEEIEVPDPAPTDAQIRRQIKMAIQEEYLNSTDPYATRVLSTDGASYLTYLWGEYHKSTYPEGYKIESYDEYSARVDHSHHSGVLGD